MLIAQVTDIHLGFEKGNPGEFNRQRLDQVLRHLNDGPNRPDLLIATGDLTEHGDAASYRQLANAFSICSFPVHMCIGNHDIRSNFSAQFPELPVADGFVQYALEVRGVRILMLDTVEEGRHGGAFCDMRTKWLRSTLAQDRNTPTIIAMHHPPVEIGIAWMNTHPEEPWVSNFTQAIQDAPNIKGIMCGHVHRSIAVPWQGTAVAICSSTAAQVTLDLNPIDPEKPDNRPMIIADQPAYALHFWNGRELVSHFDNAGDHAMLAKYDAYLQPLIKQLIGERPN
ncbi:metallophosphoesterase [Sphingorhabdus sp.]|uniref:metallophosphoesterase n=1 Tax=Sphingorhabdus sp. TaxID=1902408 RepID=UPI0026195F17|nr:metallophosphoesterase [Sphingorhabdus sp.]MDH4399851.1 metallophosphoesterase [Sphingorhabdus sp.]